MATEATARKKRAPTLYFISGIKIDNPFSLEGGVGAVWIRAKESPGTIRLVARHPYLGTKTVEITVRPVEPEGV